MVIPGSVKNSSLLFTNCENTVFWWVCRTSQRYSLYWTEKNSAECKNKDSFLFLPCYTLMCKLSIAHCQKIYRLALSIRMKTLINRLISHSRVFWKVDFSCIRVWSLYSLKGYKKLNTLSSIKLIDLSVSISSLLTDLYPKSFSVGPHTFCTTWAILNGKLNLHFSTCSEEFFFVE